MVKAKEANLRSRMERDATDCAAAKMLKREPCHNGDDDCAVCNDGAAVLHVGHSHAHASTPPPLGKWSYTADVARAFPQGAEELKRATVIVTGANGGIGRETAKALATIGARVVLACRNLAKAGVAKTYILNSSKLGESGRVVCMELDLASPQSIKAFVARFTKQSQEERWDPLSTLVRNAGITALGGLRVNQEGTESTFATNHLGHCLLVKLLLPVLKQYAPLARVVVVGSNSHFGPLATKDMLNKEAIMTKVVRPEKRDFSPMKAYGSSKLFNTLFACALHRQYASDGVVACSLHPGSMIASDIGRESWIANFYLKYINSWFAKSVDQGASTTVMCCLMPASELKGQYFNDCAVFAPSPLAQDENVQSFAWALTDELLRAHL